MPCAITCPAAIPSLTSTPAPPAKTVAVEPGTYPHERVRARAPREAVGAEVNSLGKSLCGHGGTERELSVDADGDFLDLQVASRSSTARAGPLPARFRKRCPRACPVPQEADVPSPRYREGRARESAWPLRQSRPVRGARRLREAAYPPQPRPILARDDSACHTFPPRTLICIDVSVE